MSEIEPSAEMRQYWRTWQRLRPGGRAAIWQALSLAWQIRQTEQAMAAELRRGATRVRWPGREGGQAAVQEAKALIRQWAELTPFQASERLGRRRGLRGARDLLRKPWLQVTKIWRWLDHLDSRGSCDGPVGWWAYHMLRRMRDGRAPEAAELWWGRVLGAITQSNRPHGAPDLCWLCHPLCLLGAGQRWLPTRAWEIAAEQAELEAAEIPLGRPEWTHVGPPVGWDAGLYADVCDLLPAIYADRPYISENSMTRDPELDHVSAHRRAQAVRLAAATRGPAVEHIAAHLYPWPREEAAAHRGQASLLPGATRAVVDRVAVPGGADIQWPRQQQWPLGRAGAAVPVLTRLLQFQRTAQGATWYECQTAVTHLQLVSLVQDGGVARLQGWLTRQLRALVALSRQWTRQHPGEPAAVARVAVLCEHERERSPEGGWVWTYARRMVPSVAHLAEREARRARQQGESEERLEPTLEDHAAAVLREVDAEGLPPGEREREIERRWAERIGEPAVQRLLVAAIVRGLMQSLERITSYRVLFAWAGQVAIEHMHVGTGGEEGEGEGEGQ